MNLPQNKHYVFRLFISEATPKVDQAVAMLEHICQTYLEGMCNIEVIDITKNPKVCIEENILATPTLIKNLPKPARRIIGDLLDKDKLLLSLDICNQK